MATALMHLSSHKAQELQEPSRLGGGGRQEGGQTEQSCGNLPCSSRPTSTTKGRMETEEWDCRRSDRALNWKSALHSH